MKKDRRPTIAIMAGNAESEYFNQLIAGFRNCAKEEDVKNLLEDLNILLSAQSDDLLTMFEEAN